MCNPLTSGFNKLILRKLAFFSRLLAALGSCHQLGTGHRRQRARADPARPALSSRELEVLRLLADGASNPDISKTLYISRRTASSTSLPNSK